MMRRAATVAAILLCAAAGAPRAMAQESEVLLPEQSAAKAKAVLQQAIQALGGQKYLAVRDIDCTGRLAQFGSSGELMGYVRFRDLWRLPDKNRTEYGKKRNIIDLYAGKEGWTLDRAGVHELPASAVEDFQNGLKTDLDNLLRFRLNDPGMIFRYGGGDIVDLKQVDWVEIVDPDKRTTRIAVDVNTHLPVRSVVVTRNARTRERDQDTTYFANYHPLNGIQTPYQVLRFHNDRKVYQAFYKECAYDSGLADSLFTRASLEEQWAKVGKKK